MIKFRSSKTNWFLTSLQEEFLTYNKGICQLSFSEGAGGVSLLLTNHRTQTLYRLHLWKLWPSTKCNLKQPPPEEVGGREQTVRVIEHMDRTLNIVFPHGKKCWDLVFLKDYAVFLYVTSFDWRRPSLPEEEQKGNRWSIMPYSLQHLHDGETFPAWKDLCVIHTSGSQLSPLPSLFLWLWARAQPGAKGTPG